MKRLFVSAIVLVATGSTAQAEIICTNRGCWETGGRIYRNGGGYSGLPYHNHRDMTLNAKGYPQPAKRVRITRESW